MAALVVALAVGLVVASQGGGSPDLEELAPAGTVVVEEDLSREHVDGDVDYDRSPPVGGPHAPVWQNCGFYTEPVVTERGVHSLEHGAVWITYGPDVDEEGVATLRELTDGEPFVLATPFEGLDGVVASAWGLQLRVEGPDDPRLVEFVDAFAQGPQTPEPGTPCDGGVGEPS